jgi:hypothetical protein
VGIDVHKKTYVISAYCDGDVRVASVRGLLSKSKMLKYQTLNME